MEKIKNWFYKPAFTLICYAIALLIICYFGYTVNISYQSVVSYVEAGSISWSANFGEIVAYFMSNTFSYFFYAMTFVFFGKVISIIKPRAPKQEIVEEINDNVENNKLVVPGMTLRELLKILKDDEENVDIIVSDRTVLFDFGYYQVYSRLLDGEFLKYDAIISVVNTLNVVVEKSLITDSLERALLLINDDISAKSENKVPVRFNIGYDKIDVSCITGKGQVNDTVPVELDGDNLLIGFNCRFLLDALSACDEEKVKMEFSAPTSGCFIKSVEGDDSYIYMILPVRLYN